MEFLFNSKIEYLNLKPENILIQELLNENINKEKIQLVDYGMKFLSKEKINNYMSPELFKNSITKK